VTFVTPTKKSCARTISKRSWPRRPEYTLDSGVRKGEPPVTANISREELKAMMDRGENFILVDALSAGHYQSSHLPGAINLPYEFVDEAESLLPDKDAEIVVYCMNVDCEASTEEARELEGMGYRHVRHYAEGKQDWIKAGLPVEGKRASEKSRS
jgi:rhodanese-related sulfurtransferase